MDRSRRCRVRRSFEKPLWYFTSPEPKGESSSGLSSNSEKIDSKDLAEDVREHVQPTAVGHAEHDLADAQLVGRVLDHRVEQRDQRLRPLERETLLPQELGVEEALEELGRRELLEDPPALVVAHDRRVLVHLHPLLEPGLATGILDVRELDTDRAAVGVAQTFEDLAAASGPAAPSRCPAWKGVSRSALPNP